MMHPCMDIGDKQGSNSPCFRHPAQCLIRQHQGNPLVMGGSGIFKFHDYNYSCNCNC